VGDRVRVDLAGRSVRGWVLEVVDAERELKPLTKWLGLGPPPEMMELATWAAHRWYGPLSRFLLAASPERIVTSLPVAPRKTVLSDVVRRGETPFAPGVIRLAPTIDPLGIVLAAYEATRQRSGSLLVLVPTEAWAHRLAGRLAQRGCAVALSHEWDKIRAQWPVVVGSRGTAFAPCAHVAGAVVIDGDDEAYRSEASPTWEASEVVRRRCDLDGSPWWMSSPVPSPTLSFHATVSVAPDEFAQWPAVDVVDRRSSDPRDGVLAGDVVNAAHRALQGDEKIAVAVVLQRLGAGRLFACTRCGELARCEQCAQGEIEIDGLLSCPQHPGSREMFCRSCGATKLRRVRSGTSTLARDVALQLSQEVSELTARSHLDIELARVVVGTEAIFSRVRRAALVVFADFDQYLLAPRERARRDALVAVAKASRLCGSRRDGRGRVMIQTRRGDDDVLRILRSGALDELLRDDDEVARELHMPPYGALAQITGENAEQFATALAGNAVTVTRGVDGWTASAANVDVLTDRLSATVRPSGRLRVAVS
jgi:primosomal protein N' (replication factor Y)